MNKLEQKTLEDSCTQLDFNENGGWIDLTTEDHKIIRIYREDIPGLMRFVMEAYFKRYDK